MQSYKYHYNELGLFVQIDTNGLFGYGYGSNLDTMQTTYTKEYISYGNEKRLIRKIFRIKTDTIEFHTIYAYNSSGKVIKETHLSGKNEQSLEITYYVEYLYLVCGLVKEQISLDKQMKIMSRRVYEYEMY